MVVNIGPRQNSGFRSFNVFDIKYNVSQIYEKCLKTKNLYLYGKFN